MEQTAVAATEVAELLTVLIVDDEKNIRNSLMRILRPHGYRVLSAESGAEGLDLLARTPVDLVLSDMRMPEMDGARFLRLVKDRSPDTVRILLTGYSDIESTISAINDGGIYRYIAKPWDDAALVSVVDNALQIKRLRRERDRLHALTQQQNRELVALNATLEAKVEQRTSELARALREIQGAHEKLKKSFLATIRTFSNVIELREGASAGHSRHVADLARRLAQRMSLPEQEVNDVTLAGLLHGLGELGIPDTILGKPTTRLSLEERALYIKHPAKAQSALMASEQLSGAGRIIRAYRENFDGTGYPDGESGFSIPLGARILSVAHDYEAAQEGTFTGQWLSKLQARQLVLDGRGTRYDPDVVDAFMGLLQESGVKPLERVVKSGDLTPGMVLTRDLTTPEGLLLLSRDTVLDARLIEQLQRYVARDAGALQVHTRV